MDESKTYYLLGQQFLPVNSDLPYDISFNLKAGNTESETQATFFIECYASNSLVDNPVLKGHRVVDGKEALVVTNIE